MRLPSLPSLFPSGEAEQQVYGLFGDYVGGFWGTIISVATFGVIYWTWQSSRANDKRNSAVSILSEMLKTHDHIVTVNSDFTGKTGSPSRLIRDFSLIYRMAKKINSESGFWSQYDLIDISYTYAYYGPSSHARKILKDYGEPCTKNLGDEIARARDKARERNRFIYTGHQAPMSNYMRNLFAMYTFIENSSLSKKDKVNLSKVVRSKLSNFEQAALALNAMSHLGQPWETDGILDRYKPFANVPRYFFSFEKSFSLSDRFPHVRFEWQTNAVKRIFRKQFSLGHATIAISFWSRRT